MFLRSVFALSLALSMSLFTSRADPGEDRVAVWGFLGEKEQSAALAPLEHEYVPQVKRIGNDWACGLILTEAQWKRFLGSGRKESPTWKNGQVIAFVTVLRGGRVLVPGETDLDRKDARCPFVLKQDGRQSLFHQNLRPILCIRIDPKAVETVTFHGEDESNGGSVPSRPVKFGPFRLACPRMCDACERRGGFPNAEAVKECLECKRGTEFGRVCSACARRKDICWRCAKKLSELTLPDLPTCEGCLSRCSECRKPLQENAGKAAPACPDCKKADATIPIVYGMPGKDLAKQAEEGKILLGGCQPEPEQWHCKTCKKRW